MYKEIDLVIIGGGSAGLAAAIEAKRNGVDNILILEKDEHLGGILNQCIHNGFGLEEFKEELTGPEYLSRFVLEAQKLEIPYRLLSFVNYIGQDKTVRYSNSYEGEVEIKAKAIILATGCYERTPGMISLPGSRISGIYTAGVAQKYLNIYGFLPGKKIVILGSGDIGLIMARRFTLEGAKVICVCELMPYSNGLNRNIAQCLNDFNIPLYLSTTVSNVYGKNRVEKVTIAKVDQNLKIIPNTEQDIECDTLILSVGLLPYLKVSKNLNLKFDKRYLQVNENMETSIPGVFACGNCLHVHDLVDYVTKEGRTAGLGAAKYLNSYSENRNYIDLEYDENISYVIPQKISKFLSDDIIIKFRIKTPIKDAYIVLLVDNEIIYKIYKTALIPSEMIIMNIKRDIIKTDFNKIKLEIRKKYE